MPLKPLHQILNVPPKPQFLLTDFTGREFGIIEHYETDRAKATAHMLLEFFSPDPNLISPPLIWVDIDRWLVLEGHGKNLPDADFEAGLNAYLQSFSEEERDLRRDRARKARNWDMIQLVETGYTIAYQEMFPGELAAEDFPTVKIAGQNYIVDDQYGIRPGEFHNQVTLVFILEKKSKNKMEGQKENQKESKSSTLQSEVGKDVDLEPALLCNWIFGQGYEILQTDLAEDLCHKAITALVENPELEKIYRERLIKMRREGVLLGIAAKPYTPRNPNAALKAVDEETFIAQGESPAKNKDEEKG